MRYIVIEFKDEEFDPCIEGETMEAVSDALCDVSYESIEVVEPSDREIIQDKDGDLWENYGEGEGVEKRFFLVADPTTTETLGTIVGVHGPIKRAAWY
jgi:hypothetical protein